MQPESTDRTAVAAAIEHYFAEPANYAHADDVAALVLECVSRAENLRRRHARERDELPAGHAGLVPPRRAA